MHSQVPHFANGMFGYFICDSIEAKGCTKQVKIGEIQEREKRMKKSIKIVLLVLTVCIGIMLLAVCGLFAWLTITEYRPEAKENVPVHLAASGENTDRILKEEQELSILTWNTGYAGLDASVDFFMDGGTMVNPAGSEVIRENMNGILEQLQEEADGIFLLQEVDRDCSRTMGVDELEYYVQQTGYSWAYGVNYRCKYVPYPLPPLGRMETGVATLSGFLCEEDAVRVSLPCPFSWPVRTANLKRCLLISRFPVEGTDRQLVAVNLHLEAYDSGEGKAAQTAALLEILEEEYQKGNYVIAGGDFNQSFPGSFETYPVKNPELWAPGELEMDELPEGFRLVYDSETPTCRLLNQPYDPEDAATQYYIIDGFIVSDNLEIQSVETKDLAFRYSDHNPVRLVVKLK